MDSHGVVLIVTLWILAILILFVLGLGFRLSLEARLTDYKVQETRNLYLAKAAVGTLKAALRADDTEDYDALADVWSSEEGFFKDISPGGMEGAFTVSYVRTVGGAETIFYGAEDEEAKININTAPKGILEEMLKEAGAEERAEEIADSIIAWRDEEENPDEDDYYSFFSEFPYYCKNGLFESKEELLLVRGIDTDRELYNAIKDKVAVYGEGRVNLNTVGSEVLSILGLTENGVDEILTYLAGADGEVGTDDDGIFRDINELIGKDSILGDDSDKTLLGNLSNENLIGFKSNHFRAQITAKSGDAKVIKKVEAVVSRENKGEVVFWHEH